MRKIFVLTIVLAAAGLLIAASLAWMVYSATGQAAAGFDSVERQQRVAALTNDMRVNTFIMSSSLRGYLLDPSRRDEVTRKTEADTRMGAAVETLRKTSSDASLIAQLDTIARRDAEHLQPLEEQVNALATTNLKEAVRLYYDKYQPIFSEQLGAIDELDRTAARSMTATLESQVASQQQLKRQLAWWTIGLLLLVVAIATWVARSVLAVTKVARATVHEMKQNAEQVTSAAGQVATSSQSLSQGATEQAASLEETSASMEEMASMTRKNAENSNRAAELMTESARLVATSNQALGEMVASMGAISESSHQVAKIIKTIDEIAFQTNILALNAAVEAARAGEAGMGFAVVADEVRNLAQRSAQAAKDTAGLIEASLAKSQEGNQKVQQVAAAITAITESSANVKRLVDEVSVASGQQAQGFDQVSQAVAQMEKVTQTTAATAEESAAASEELNAQAESAMRIVGQLEAIVGGHGVAATAPATARRLSARTANVVKMAGSAIARKTVSVEEALPLADTGTYGKF